MSWGSLRERKLSIALRGKKRLKSVGEVVMIK